jgi:hypothetical protein
MQPIKMFQQFLALVGVLVFGDEANSNRLEYLSFVLDVSQLIVKLLGEFFVKGQAGAIGSLSKLGSKNECKKDRFMKCLG